MAEERTELGLGIEAALQEVRAYRRGELALPTQRVGAMPADRVKAIRKAVSTSTRDFERKFAVPARTVEGWEQGKRVDAPAAALLRVIERNPELAEEALRQAEHA